MNWTRTPDGRWYTCVAEGIINTEAYIKRADDGRFTVTVCGPKIGIVCGDAATLDGAKRGAEALLMGGGDNDD